jgi:N-acetylneuraminate synthase
MTAFNGQRRVFVIAEAGVNHNGDLALALDLVDAAAEAGADTVKFQTFRAEALASPAAAKADYQQAATGCGGSQLDMLRRLELDETAHQTLIARARDRGIEFLSTPFDLGSLQLLTRTLCLARLKIGSGDLTNTPLLLAAAHSNRLIILSTGMATLHEVELALGALAYGYLGGARPTRAAFDQALASHDGQAALKDKVTLLHCTTEYPAPPADINLRAIDTLANAFHLPVGLSDHSEGIAIAIAAVGRGAVAIEKHLTLDRALPGPDHRASLEPDELAAMVRAIREVEAALGDGIKRPSPAERKNMTVARKSLVAARTIQAGELFSADNLTVKRPGDGLPPTDYWALLGRKAPRDFSADEAIDAGGAA